ncbi:hypothetical protein EBB07_34605 [Paenibacillaceae bacterium]|nr:hypothetical protein EBB07_34605 [Paenibacillaceae bacterium]
MSIIRQQILILNIADPNLESQTVAWALYDGAKAENEPQMTTGDSDVPPYPNVLAAMRDGWNVLQVPALPHYFSGHEHESNHLPYEYVLERKVVIDE